MITAIIQARMSSTRLPKKVLLPLGNKTVLENVINRVRQAKLISNIIVATSVEFADDVLEKFCLEKKINCFRGDSDDVLDRYYQTARQFKVEHICRITSDCPLIDPVVVDKAAGIYLTGKYDYIANNHPIATYPDGLDTEIFSFFALKKTWKEASLPSEREHVTSYIWKNPDKFKIYNLKNNKDLSGYRLTIDEEKDYKLLQAIFSQVKDLTTINIINFLDNDQKTRDINKNIIRDEGYLQSLINDNKLNKNHTKLKL